MDGLTLHVCGCGCLIHQTVSASIPQVLTVGLVLHFLVLHLGAKSRQRLITGICTRKPRITNPQRTSKLLKPLILNHRTKILF